MAPSDNLSWNCGVEGPSDDPAVERLRNRQVKNFLTLTMLAVGTPMLLMGDEVRRTQRGNNNAYCINDDTTWFDWDLVARHGDVHRFAKELIALRIEPQPADRAARHDAAGAAAAPVGHVARRQTERAGLGPRLAHAGGDRPLARRPGPAPRHRQRLLGGAGFEIPPPATRAAWRRIIDTSLDSPDDVCAWADAPTVRDPTYVVQPRSVVLLIATAGNSDRVEPPATATRQRRRARA